MYIDLFKPPQLFLKGGKKIEKRREERKIHAFTSQAQAHHQNGFGGL